MPALTFRPSRTPSAPLGFDVKKNSNMPTESENIEPTQLEENINALAEKWWARYIAGVVLLIAGGFLLDHFLDLEPGKRWNSYIHYWLAMFALFELGNYLHERGVWLCFSFAVFWRDRLRIFWNDCWPSGELSNNYWRNDHREFK